MPRRSRIEQRLLKDQDTVGGRRAERQEQEELAGKKKKTEGALTKAQRMARIAETEHDAKDKPVRVARVGKPLKRP